MFSFLAGKKGGLAKQMVASRGKTTQEIIDECPKQTGYVPSVEWCELDYNGDKFGGYPSLETDTPWPFHNGIPMYFLCQLTDPYEGGPAYQVFALADEYLVRRINYLTCSTRQPISTETVCANSYKVNIWYERYEPIQSIEELCHIAKHNEQDEREITRWYNDITSGISFHGRSEDCVLTLADTSYFPCGGHVIKIRRG